MSSKAFAVVEEQLMEYIYCKTNSENISPHKKTVYALFVDLTAAFDHVRRKWLFKSIKQKFPRHNNNILIELLEGLYSYTTTALN